jgi:hypothetical protein
MKQINVVLILVGFILATTGAAVHASSCDKGKYQSKSGHKMLIKHFSDMDTDGNGSLSFEEFKNLFPSTEQKAFDRLDGDKDGVLSHEEWHQFKEMHKGMKKHHEKRYHAEKLPDPCKIQRPLS